MSRGDEEAAEAGAGPSGDGGRVQGIWEIAAAEAEAAAQSASSTAASAPGSSLSSPFARLSHAFHEHELPGFDRRGGGGGRGRARLGSGLGADLESVPSGFSTIPNFESSSVDSDMQVLEVAAGDEMPTASGRPSLQGAPPRTGCSVVMRMRLRRMSVLQAATSLYNLEPGAAQSCIAMLAAPGGLYLDIKSGYSSAQQLKQFASTLAGIGVNVKAICSFVPAQIDFSQTKDTLPWGGHKREASSGDSRRQPASLSFTSGLATGSERVPSSSARVGSGTALNARQPGTWDAQQRAAAGSARAGPIDVPSEAAAPGTSGTDGRAPAPPPRLPYDSVLFFHGLNGLELACESGRVAPGTCVLFNGASMLLESAEAMAENVREATDQARKARGGDKPTPGRLQRSKTVRHTREHLSSYTTREVPDLVDMEAWRRYCTLLSVFQVYGGIYVQEPDAAPPSVAALVSLVNAYPGHFPLGFAYGHLSCKAVAVAGHTGRGLAAQQLLEELSSRKQLSAKVQKRIQEGMHLSSSDEVYISWGRRLLYRPGLMYQTEQALLLQLLADYPVENALPDLVEDLGGVRRVFLRFFEHYEATSPFTLFELGFNMNYTKPLMRLLRNRGVLAALSEEKKLELGSWLLGGTRGQLAGWMHVFGRGDVHKLVKEAFLCLAESCTSHEFKTLLQDVGGEERVRKLLRGQWGLAGQTYEGRLKVVQQHLQKHPMDPAYLNNGYGYVQYARPPGRKQIIVGWRQWVTGLCGKSERSPISEREEGLVTTDPRHTRDKPWHYMWKHQTIKALVCVYTSCWWTSLLAATCCLWSLFAFPKLLYPYCRNRLLPLAMAIALVVIWALMLTGILYYIVTAVVPDPVEEIVYMDYSTDGYGDYSDYAITAGPGSQVLQVQRLQQPGIRQRRMLRR